MNSIPKILLVEDDDFSASLTTAILGADYQVQRVADGRAALRAVAEQSPDLVLLDVDMPGMSGYEVCRALRDDPATGDLPIIFLSGKVGEQDRLAGYEAGGDDYLTKPAPARELQSKVNILLEHYSERNRLKKDLSNAFSTAMTAMSGMAELGAVLQFLRASFGCQTYIELCREMLNVFNSYGLEANVQIRGQQKQVSLNANGPCSPLEESVLTTMSTHSRLFEFGSHISYVSCSFEHVTAIFKSDPHGDPDRHGRMKDNIALLVEGANARVIALDGNALIARQHATLAQIESTREALHGIDQRYRMHGLKSGQIFEELQRNFDRCMLTIGITQSQEEELANMITDAASRAKALYDEGLETGAHMENLLKRLAHPDD